MRDAIYKIKGLELNKLKQDFPLEKWFYQMVQKKEKDLTIKDISHMLRQEVYLDLAVPIAWNRIVDDPLCGELYEGQMIELLTRVFINKPELREKEKYLSFEKKMEKVYKQYEWENEYEKEEQCSEADFAVGTSGSVQCSGVLL